MPVMHVAKLPLILMASLGLLLTAAALAQVERSGGGANAQLYQDYQQALAERTQLQADNAKLKAALDDAKKQLAAAKQQLAAARTGASGSQAALKAAQTARAAAETSLQALKGQTQELIERFRQTIATLQGVEIDRTGLRRDLAQSKAAFDQCALANYQLYQVDDEVLNRFAHQSTFSCMAQKEPFTRLERTRIDNLVLEYRQRAEQLRVQHSATAQKNPAPSAKPAPTGNAATAPSAPPKN